MLNRRTLIELGPAALAACSVASLSDAAPEQPASARSLTEATRAFSEAIMSGNVSRMVALHADDAFVVYGPGPNTTPAVLRKTWEEYFAPKPGPDGVTIQPYHPVETDHVEASGDLGYSRGRYWHGQKGAGPEKYRGGGYFTAVWKRRLDGWRIVAFASTATREMPPVGPVAHA